jgi:hypothetical protein
VVAATLFRVFEPPAEKSIFMIAFRGNFKGPQTAVREAEFEGVTDFADIRYPLRKCGGCMMQ